ncbi:MAG: serine/threonine-protein kinase, partial [Polyangiaceae bacterium]
MAFSDRVVGRLRQISAEDTLARELVVVREVGAGAMGRVYEAVHHETGRRIALKILSRDTSVDRARFAAEASALERLDHPAIVGYVAHGITADGEAYLAMEWLQGHTLSKHLEGGPLTILEAVILGRRVCEALAAAHAQGIIHRDLKPTNLFLLEGRVDAVKVVDFGIAREIGVERELTRTGEVVGTPGYMAPEQARGQKTLDGRTDLFALGCVLFRSISGRPAFEGEDVLSVLSKLILQDPPRVSQASAPVPKQLERLVARMLAKDPAQRPASAEAALAELRP